MWRVHRLALPSFCCKLGYFDALMSRNLSCLPGSPISSCALTFPCDHARLGIFTPVQVIYAFCVIIYLLQDLYFVVCA